MQSMRKVRVGVATWVLIAAAGPAGILAQRGGTPSQQQPPAQRVLVQVAHVKPDMVGTYQDLIKNDLVPALKKAGVAYRWTWTTGPMGGEGFTFIGLQPITSYAQFDQGPAAQRAMGPEAFANYNAKLRATLVSTENFIETLRTDISIQSGSTTPPPLAQVMVFQIAPGKGEDFTRVMTTDYLPNYRKAGVKDFWAYARNYGEIPNGQIVTVLPLSKYADLDQPALLQRAGLTSETVAQINARRTATGSFLSNVIMRLVPELSFGAPAPRSTSQ